MKRSKFNLSHYHLTSFDMGEVIPISAVEALPGDRFQQSAEALIRVTPQQKPVMHPVQVQIMHYFVPNRILWDGWEDFITGESDTPPPTITGGAHTEGTLSDYLGVYDDASNDFLALPVRAYNKIWNEEFRDKDLDSEVSEDTNTIQRVRWGKDYFTTARPWAQKGTQVTIPLGSTAPVLGIGTINQTPTTGGSNRYETGGSAATTYTKEWQTGANAFIEEDSSNTGFPGIYADLSSASGPDIRAFREAFAIQKWQEARARYGSDYVDYLAYYGVNAGDARLQRPEYLGGGSAGIAFSEVMQTSPTAVSGTTISSGVGDLRGHGIAAMRSNAYRRQFNEHGWVITLMFVRPRAIYTQALPRKFTRTDRTDYYTRELADVGAQEVYNRELYAGHTTPDGIFGYSTRYAEYFSEQSRVSSEFRNSQSYDWHFGRIFGSDPALNSTFLECNPTKRVFFEQSEDSLWVMVNNKIVARRPVRRSSIGRLG